MVQDISISIGLRNMILCRQVGACSLSAMRYVGKPRMCEHALRGQALHAEQRTIDNVNRQVNSIKHLPQAPNCVRMAHGHVPPRGEQHQTLCLFP